MQARWRKAARSLQQRLSPVRAQSLPVAVNARRIYVLPTGLGLFYAGMVLAMTLGALNYANNPALLLALLLAGVGLASALAAHLQLSALVLRSAAATPVAAGQPLQVQLQLEASDGRPRDGLQLRFDSSTLAALASGPAQAMRATADLPSQRRGMQAMPPLTIWTIQPLGLVRAWTRLQPSGSLLVHPAAETDGPALPQSPPSGNSRAVNDSEQDQLRDYRHGDSPGSVAWKASARRGNLLVREATAGASSQLRLDWDSLGGMDNEARIARLAHWVHQADQHDLHWTLHLPAQPAIGPACGPDHRLHCLRALALLPDAH